MQTTAGTEWPMVDVIVAVRNEARMIAGKLRELDAIAYPADRLHFVIVDGGSSDGTIAEVSAHAGQDPRWLTLHTLLANKPAQLNEALACTGAPWVLVTDADARVPADTLRRLLDEASSDPLIGVVGTTVEPFDPHPLDAWHWRLSNWIRRRERRAGATGIVVGTCYLFRRDLLDRFPEDVVADDVYVVCRAAGQGARTALVDQAVVELRVAGSSAWWFRHKLRRTLGYLREVLRFAPGLFRIPAPMRTVLLWRSLALTVGPLAGLAFVLWLVLAFGLTPVAGGMLVLGVAGSIRPATTRGVTGMLGAAALPLWILCITLTALVLYPFVRQSGSYRRPAMRVDESEACS